MKARTLATREGALLAALARTRRLIARYLRQWNASWPYAWDFNQLHELEARLELRLVHLWQAHYDLLTTTPARRQGHPLA